MKTLLLDSSFIISATKEKIDFFEELQEYKIIIPEQVIDEIFRISNSKQSIKNRQAAELALKILKTCEHKFKKIDLGKGHVDKQIVKYSKDHKALFIGTLDKELRSKFTKGKVITIRGKNKFEVV